MKYVNYMKYVYIYISIIVLLILSSCKNPSKDTIEVVDFDGLYSKIDLSVEKTYVINFWATWCAPCVKELPYFEEVNKQLRDKNTEVILVSLDFPSQIETKLKPFLKRNKIKSKVILLDDSKMNTWVTKVSERWDGGIPATLIVNSSNYNFYPKPFKKEELFSEINKVLK